MQFRFFILFLAIILLSLFSCGEKIEGCLDITATNFDAEADTHCCCTYPNMIFNVNHVYDTLSFRLEEIYPYPNNSIDSFIIDTCNILFSNIHPYQGGNTFEVNDTLHIGVNDALGEETLIIENNFALVSPDQFSYTIGSFALPGNYDGIQLNFGLDEETSRIIPDSVYISNHVLNNEVDSVWEQTKGYFFMYLSVIPDHNQIDVYKKITIFGNINMLNLDIQGNIFGDTGYDFDINLKIDYNLLFNGIDFEADSENSITNQILDNFPFALSIIE